ncbi:hypothetical protein TCAL_17294 [Tigriopus californicus]|uniref:Fibrinogen C-terminal domain-containing protein n=1 Tax=Tigriopus californicus TaxID=6832 RepID=A0A553NX78_TIGCA|nr:hypothetical protein TCAL_17294 [Tigriopus californicus]
MGSAAIGLGDVVTYRCLGDARLEQGTNFTIECGHDGSYQNLSWPTCVLRFRVPAETFNLSTSQPNGISNASTHGPGQAFDGNWATMFKINSSGNIPFLQVDFGQERLPLSIKLVLPNASSGCINNHEDLRVAALNSSLNPGEDPSSRTILEADIQSGIFIFDKPALTRYLVVHAPTGGSSTPLCIAEMDIQFRPKVPYPPVKDCAQLMAYGSQGSSIYNLDITGGLNPENVADVLCRESQWTPILRRFHPQDVNDMFSRHSNDSGFRSRRLLSTEPYELRVEMVDRDDKYRRAVYNTFTIESSSSRYRLSVDDFDPSQSVGDPGMPCNSFKPGVLRRTFCSSVNFFADYDENDERPSEQAIFWDTGHSKGRLKQIELTIRPKDTNYNASMTNYFENYRTRWKSTNTAPSIRKRCTEPPLLDPSNNMEVKDWRYDGVPVQANVVTIGCKRNWKDDNGQDIDIQASCQAEKQI